MQGCTVTSRQPSGLIGSANSHSALQHTASRGGVHNKQEISVAQTRLLGTSNLTPLTQVSFGPGFVVCVQERPA